MIGVTCKVTGGDKVAAAIEAQLRRTLSAETRQKILIEEGQPVADRLTAVAPRGPHNPHAAEFIAVTPVKSFNKDDVTVAIGVVDVPGKHDRGFVFRFLEFGTSRRSATPFLRPTMDVELPLMIERVRARVAKALQS